MELLEWGQRSQMHERRVGDGLRGQRVLLKAQVQALTLLKRVWAKRVQRRPVQLDALSRPVVSHHRVSHGGLWVQPRLARAEEDSEQGYRHNSGGVPVSCREYDG